MGWFYNLKIGKKLLLSFGVVLLLMFVTCLYLVSDMRKIDKAYGTLIDREAFVAVHSLFALSNYNQAAADLGQYITGGDPANADEFRKNIGDAEDSMKKIPPLLETEEGKQQYKDFQEKADAFKQYGEHVIILVNAREVRGGDRAAAEKQLADYLESNSKVMEKMASAGEVIVSRQEKRLETDNDANSARVSKSITVSIIFVVVTILLGLFIAFFIARIINRPLIKITGAAEKVSRGDLGVDVTANTKDEIGILAQSFETMTETIKFLLKETNGLIKAVQEGKLDTRGNAAAFAGGWSELVAGINKLIDARWAAG